MTNIKDQSLDLFALRLLLRVLLIGAGLVAVVAGAFYWLFWDDYLVVCISNICIFFRGLSNF